LVTLPVPGLGVGAPRAGRDPLLLEGLTVEGCPEPGFRVVPVPVPEPVPPKPLPIPVPAAEGGVIAEEPGVREELVPPVRTVVPGKGTLTLPPPAGKLAPCNLFVSNPVSRLLFVIAPVCVPAATVAPGLLRSMRKTV